MTLLLTLLKLVVDILTSWTFYLGVVLGYLFPGDVKKIWLWIKSKW